MNQFCSSYDTPNFDKGLCHSANRLHHQHRHNHFQKWALAPPCYQFTEAKMRWPLSQIIQVLLAHVLALLTLTNKQEEESWSCWHSHWSNHSKLWLLVVRLRNLEKLMHATCVTNKSLHTAYSHMLSLASSLLNMLARPWSGGFTADGPCLGCPHNGSEVEEHAARKHRLWVTWHDLKNMRQCIIGRRHILVH